MESISFLALRTTLTCFSIILPFKVTTTEDMQIMA
jgi:hypothetical protein